MLALIIAAMLAVTPITEEQKIVSSINEYRAEHNLPPVVWSDSLAYVARLHSEDVFTNWRFGNKNCDSHSWSLSKRWIGGCVSDKINISISTSKPRELTGMPENGYEFLHIHEDKFFKCYSSCAMMEFLTNTSTSGMIIENGWDRWSKIGVSFYYGVVSVWMSH